jgi:NADPH:quinone reductase-like Zn-dependent oxidoreductase
MSKTMRAFAATAIGPIQNCKVMDLPIPEPGPGDVRIRVISAAFNPADAKTILGKTGLLHAKGFPLVMGYDVSGVVDALGAGVEDLHIGAEVFGMLAYSRRTQFGSLAEYTIVPARWLAEKPAHLDHDTAAALATAGLTALQGLRGPGRLKEGNRVLVTGSSGGVGALAIGVVRAVGGKADAITSTGGAKLARIVGAETVVDRSAPDFLSSLNGPYQIVYDAAAAYSMRTFRRVLAKGGTYVTTLPTLTLPLDVLTAPFLRRRIRLVMVKPSRADLLTLADFTKQGLVVPIAERVPLANAATALADYHAHGARGKIVVRIS